LGAVIRYKNDTRQFRTFVKLNPDGSVAATMDLAADIYPEDATATYLDVTAQAPADFHAVAINMTALNQLAQTTPGVPVTLNALTAANPAAVNNAPKQVGVNLAP
jgi:hypothetical protein